MSLFQLSVLNKYLLELNKASVDLAFNRFQKHFADTQIQENIRNLKEEQYQEGFINALFVDVLGYIPNPLPGFNILMEFKNVKDSKKADAAILQQSDVIAVIELKGTDTTDLSKVEVQAFSYKTNQKNCTYVITSNFEKLRFYIDNAIDFEEFNLFSLTRERFSVLYLCLASENLLKGIPLKIKNASISEEQDITKKLYSDYSAFKRFLFQNLSDLNPQFDKLTLFKKTQKLLDRLLFIFFAEDRLLLPPNSVREIIKQWEQLKDLDSYSPLYERFKKYFGYLNTGFKGKQYDIFAYNGGLFLPDETLDNIKIDDTILYEHTIKLSNYDFATEVDVNILGHIFEHSLNEIEEIQANLEGKQIDFSKTKRKKEGVFYTPKYITKYIVENTVGALCSDKKKELGIIDDEVIISNRKSKKKELLETIDIYRNWLLNLKICDPACGSGAFLNQALDYLLDEHRKLDELIARITGASIILSDIENSVLENNIFGVDLNEEAVEIARLSLWLKTAQKGRKLSDLSKNIKCGNSLIDDPAVAVEKAFNWFIEFPQVFPHYRKPKPIYEPEPGERDYLDEVQDTTYLYKPGSTGFGKYGFDIIIGNPPYLNMTKNNSNITWLNYYISYYESIKTASSKNLFTLFNELGCKLLKQNGILSFIIPEGFLRTRSYENCVVFLKKFGLITKAVYFENWVFDEATTGSLIFVFVKNKNLVKEYKEYLCKANIEIEEVSQSLDPVIDKYNLSAFPLLKGVCNLFKGMVVQDRSNNIFKEKHNFQNKFLLGNCIDKYIINDEFYCDYKSLIIVGGTKKIEKHDVFPRILIRRTGNTLCCALLKEKALTESTLYSCSVINSDNLNNKYVLAILNSKLYSYIVKQKIITNPQAFPQILMTDIENLKIPVIDINQQHDYVEKADLMLSLNKELQEINNTFIKILQTKFENIKINNKLNGWFNLSYQEFNKELEKQKLKISLSEQAEWMKFFESEKSKALKIKGEIDETDKLIDQMVYKLYDLTPEEIDIVEGK